MAKSDPVATLVTYRPKKGKEKELQALVEKHWPTLDRVGLVTRSPALLWRATDKRSGEVYFVELFSWKDDVSSNAVEVYIHGVRKKLGNDLIQTVRGLGYVVPRE